MFAATRWSKTYDQQRGAIPLSSNCPWCTLLQGITNDEESDNDCSARLTSIGFQTKTSFCNCYPRVLTKKRKMITRRVIKKPAPASPSPSESNTNQVTHLSETSFLSHTYVLWLTVILFPGRSWRNPQCRKPGSTWDGCNSWCTDGCKRGTSQCSRCSWRQHQLW